MHLVVIVELFECYKYINYILHVFNLHTLFKLETTETSNPDIKAISNFTSNFARMKFKCIHYKRHFHKKRKNKKMRKHSVNGIVKR